MNAGVYGTAAVVAAVPLSTITGPLPVFDTNSFPAITHPTPPRGIALPAPEPAHAKPVTQPTFTPNDDLGVRAQIAQAISRQHQEQIKHETYMRHLAQLRGVRIAKEREARRQAQINAAAVATPAHTDTPKPSYTPTHAVSAAPRPTYTPTHASATPTATHTASPSPSASTTQTTSTSAYVSTVAARAIAFAKAQIGKPYVYGATGPSSYDCSGLVYAAYRSAGRYLPRTSYGMLSGLRRVSRSSMQPGDILVFYGGGHVGLYIGGGVFIHAPHTGTSVTRAPLSGYYSSNLLAVVRP